MRVFTQCRRVSGFKCSNAGQTRLARVTWGLWSVCVCVCGKWSSRGSYFIPKNNPNFRVCLPPIIPTVLAYKYLKQSLNQCLFTPTNIIINLSSGKLKHVSFNFCFGQKQNYCTLNVIVDLS